MMEPDTPVFPRLRDGRPGETTHEVKRLMENSPISMVDIVLMLDRFQKQFLIVLFGSG